MTDPWAWALLAGLGAWHGANPAMGWLFAVGLGLQERNRAAVARALVPIAAGHALSIALVVIAFVGLQSLLSPGALRLIAGTALIAFALHRIATRFAHPRWAAMRVTAFDLVVWSFLMSAAHGAGLMLVPALQRMPVAHAHSAGAAEATSSLTSSAGQALAATGIHTASMLMVTGAVALVVFDVLGLEFLRRAWVNLDVLWAAGLLAAGALTLLA